MHQERCTACFVQKIEKDCRRIAEDHYCKIPFKIPPLNCLFFFHEGRLAGANLDPARKLSPEQLQLHLELIDNGAVIVGCPTLSKFVGLMEELCG